MNYGNEERAKKRRDNGLTRELGVLRDVPPHLSRGGTRGYLVAHWISELLNDEKGLPTTASPSSLRRWYLDQILPFRMSGNGQLRTIVGLDLFLFLQFIFAFPEAEDDEICAFIFNCTGRLYDRSQVCRRKMDLQLTRKRVSTKAHQAYTPRNQAKFNIFYNHPKLHGIAGVQRSRLIDIDECGFDLLSSNRKKGCAVSGIRVSKPGNYTREAKVTVILGIEAGNRRVPGHIRGSILNPRHWLKVGITNGTMSDDFDGFLDDLMDDLENRPLLGVENDGRIFLWDNLSSHLTPLIYNLVAARDAGHRINPRPPYRPWIAPIEYVFCQLAERVRQNVYQIDNIYDLMHQIHCIVPLLNGFDATFEHCGYNLN